MHIYIVTMTDRYDTWSEAIFAECLTHAHEVADIKFGARILNIRRAK